jgi:hypothetical protein
MKNELRNTVVSLDRPVWMIAGNQISLVQRPGILARKRPAELRRLRLVNRAENDLASSVAYLVLAGSLFVSLLEFFASLPALP